MSAKIVLDSIAPCGVRLTSVEVTYWRMIHSEILTHRDRARNAASSRAIPFYREGKGKKTWAAITEAGGMVIPEVPGLNDAGEEVFNYVIPNCTYSRISRDPFMPKYIGSERPGMQAGAEIDGEDREKAIRIINQMRMACLAGCMELHDLGVHKSIINRYVEPWMRITVLVSATRWKNFFRLRCHPKAEKHFQEAACEIRDAMVASTPTPLAMGQWHMPYLRDEERALLAGGDFEGPRTAAALGETPEFWWGRDVPQAMREVSAARCARLSYMTHDGQRDIQEDLRLFGQLIDPKNLDGSDDDVIHASALEHVAQATAYSNIRSGPYVGWLQLRKLYPREDVDG